MSLNSKKKKLKEMTTTSNIGVVGKVTKALAAIGNALKNGGNSSMLELLKKYNLKVSDDVVKIEYDAMKRKLELEGRIVAKNGKPYVFITKGKGQGNTVVWNPGWIKKD